MSKHILDVQKLYKGYGNGETELVIISNLNLQVVEGQKIIITGESGCGKSTLLNIIAGLDSPTSGTIKAGSFMVADLDEDGSTEYRSHFLGLIFQFHYLLKDFTALENVYLPAYMTGVPKKEAIARAKQLLADTGLSHRLHHLPSQLSGGERQRAAVARSLINDPRLVLADEPTGNLDPANASVISDLLFSMVDQYKKTLIMVTHDHDLSKRGDICYRLEQGTLVVV